MSSVWCNTQTHRSFHPPCLLLWQVCCVDIQVGVLLGHTADRCCRYCPAALHLQDYNDALCHMGHRRIRGSQPSGSGRSLRNVSGGLAVLGSTNAYHTYTAHAPTACPCSCYDADWVPVLNPVCDSCRMWTMRSTRTTPPWPTTTPLAAQSAATRTRAPTPGASMARGTRGQGTHTTAVRSLLAVTCTVTRTEGLSSVARAGSWAWRLRTSCLPWHLPLVALPCPP